MGNRCTTPRPPPYKTLANHSRDWWINNEATDTAYPVHAANYDDLITAISQFEDNTKEWQLYYRLGSGPKVMVGNSNTYGKIPASVDQLFVIETPRSIRCRRAQELEWSVVEAAGDNVRANFKAKYVAIPVTQESHATFVRLLDNYCAKYLSHE